MSATRNRLHALDAFRGIAALWVVLYHVILRYPNFMQGHATPQTPLLPGMTQIEAGILPVLWFFLISGFVITWTIDRSRTPMDFVVSRFSRIYPAYWASLLLTVAVALLWPLPGVTLSLRDVLVNITMLQAYVNVPDVSGVYWSLAVEIVFYAYALALFALNLWRFVHLAAFAWAIAGLATALFARAGIEVVPWRVEQLLLLQFAPLLVAGMMLYHLWRGHRPVWSVATLMVCIAGIAASQPPGLTLLCVAGMGLIAWSCRGGLQWLAAAPLVWLGSISYSLYLVHEYPAYIIRRTADAAGLPPLAGMVGAVAAALLLASAISYGVERPAMRLIRNIWRARPGNRPAPTAPDAKIQASPR